MLVVDVEVTVKFRRSKMPAGWLLVVVLLAVLLGATLAAPLSYHEADPRPLAVVSELGQRLASHSRTQEAGLPSLSHLPEAGEGRLGLPSPQEIEAIKKVAQILVMLGEQVIPTIIGDIVPVPHGAASGAGNLLPVPGVEVPNDPVDDN